MPELPDFDPYVPLRRLERGPSHDLYLARHTSLERQVWIKALREEVPLSSSLADRLTREGEVLARVAHPHIIALLDAVRRPPRLWLVLEAMDGGNLTEVLEARRRGGTAAALDVQGSVALALQIARALAHAHATGFVHGAVQPRHILVSAQGRCKLSGFSLALETRATARQQPIETEPGSFEPRYLSPEQVLGEPPSAQSDVFALGVVLYELLTGLHPFPGANEQATTQNIRHATPEPPRDLNQEISAELERVVQRCLEKPPERRFESMGQLVHALEHVLGPRALADPDALVARALARAGLPARGTAPAQDTDAEELARQHARRGLRRSLGGLLGVSAALLVGGALLSAWVEAERPQTAGAAQPWAPETGAELLVVAEPWAHVFVDGVQLETTPYAAPLRLTSGVHYVRLEHPHAPAERRRLELAAGQRATLEVTMRVQGGPLDAGIDPAAPTDAGAGSP